MEGDGAGESHQCNKCRDKRKTQEQKKDILNPLYRRYNCGKRQVLNYSRWSAQGQGQQIRANWLGRRAWWMMMYSLIVSKGGWL